MTTYRIEHRNGGWSQDGLGENTGWLTIGQAVAATRLLGKLGEDWYGEYRIVNEQTGAVVRELEVSGPPRKRRGRAHMEGGAP